MKSTSAKSQNLKQELEFALRESAPASRFPPHLHNSIMGAIRAANHQEPNRVSAGLFLQRLTQLKWIPLGGVAVMMTLGVLIALHNRAAQNISTAQSIAEISSAFTASQEIVDSLPAVSVAPLSDELDKVNQDLNHTTDFLLAALP